MIAVGNVYQSERHRGLPLPSGRQTRQNSRSHAFTTSTQTGCDKILRSDVGGQWPTAKNRHRQKRRQHSWYQSHYKMLKGFGCPLPIEMVRRKYLNSIVEQDHRFIKRRTHPLLGFKSFETASATLSGIEVAHMIRKGQFKPGLCPFLQFAVLAAQPIDTKAGFRTAANFEAKLSNQQQVPGVRALMIKRSNF